MLAIALLAIVTVLVALVRGGSDTTSPGSGAGETPAQTNPYEAAYGTFTPSTTSGSGRTEISLPAGGRRAGIVSWTSADTSFDAVLATDQGTEVPLYGVGGSTGSAVYGFSPSESSDSDVMLKTLTVLTQGPWTVTITPVSSASELPAEGASGTGSHVYLYSGASRNWVVTYEARPRLWDAVQVVQWPVGGETMPHMMEGPHPYARSHLWRLGQGPSVVLIRAWRDWRISPK